MNVIQVGGQAVIEGVMMRAPKAVAVVVRRRNGELAFKEDSWRSLADRWTFLKWPVFRGPLVLVEALINGLQAFHFSANQALEDEGEAKEPLNQWALRATFIVALIIGLGLFVILPHLLAICMGRLMGIEKGVDSFWFHFTDGIIKVFFFWTYIRLISFHSEIRRVFQYHGAEHKAIHTYEHGDELTVNNARKYSSVHPRCGTSFILLVLLISMFFFAAVFPFVPGMSGMNPVAQNTFIILYKIAFMLPIAGLAYEFIRWSARAKSPRLPIRLFMAPGLWLQKLTAYEPSDSQLEVALSALATVIKMEGLSQSRKTIL
jgi:uncharacterized protein YqhQ